MKKAFAIVLGCALLPFAAHAKLELTYDVQVQTRNKDNGGMTEVVTMLNGYRCRASTTLGYSEVMKDHEGREKRVAKEQSYDYSWPTLWTGGKTEKSMTFKRNLHTIAPSISVQLQETCEKDYACTREEQSCKPDRNGNIVCGNVTVKDTCTDTKRLNWECKFDQLPVGKRPSQMSCQPENNAIAGWDPMLAWLRKKEIFATVRHVNTEERFVHDACPQGGPNSRILHFEQGMGGHPGEDDFELDVKINGQSYKMLSDSGLYAEDIRVCAEPGRPLSLTVDGVERDLFFDDEYKSSAGEIDLKPGTSQEIELTRKTYFGKVFTPPTSRVKIEVLE
jgi:hypothetical protein